MTIQIYKQGSATHLVKTDSIEKGCWVRVFEPTEAEIQNLHSSQNIPLDFLTDPLDLNEGSRVQKEKDILLFIIRSPLQEDIDEDFYFETLPLGIILKDSTLFTICSKPIPLLAKYIKYGNQEMTLQDKNTIILKLLENSALLILAYLKNIEKKHQSLELKMMKQKSNRDIIDLHNLKKNLVYFTAAIKGNISVLNKLKRNQIIVFTADESESIDDIWVEMNQALSLCETYTSMIISTINTFTSLISTELANIMKILACVTVFLIIPTLLTSIYGMNIEDIPFAHNAHTILIFSLFSLLTIIAFFFYFNRKKWI